MRQSDLKLWQRCPLSWYYQNLTDAPRKQSSALTFGSILHDCVLHLETGRDLNATIERFERFWADPTTLDPEYAIDEWLKGQNKSNLRKEGIRILTDWWDLAQWDTDTVLAREHHFIVPIGDEHELEGTLDKLAIRWQPDAQRHVLLVSDYKSTSNANMPKYEYLQHDLQFTAYCLATYDPSFWTMPNGDEFYRRYKDYPRFGEWVQLRKTKRLDAGERTEVHFNRLRYAIDAMSQSVAMRIFVPNISGESCSYCEYREICGITPEYMS